MSPTGDFLKPPGFGKNFIWMTFYFEGMGNHRHKTMTRLSVVYLSHRSYTTIAKYAQYQANSFQESLKVTSEEK